MRGLAALSVVVYHTYIILMEPQYGGHVLFAPVARHGVLGVSFFFVLSGFIISSAHWRDIGQPAAISRYAVRRAPDLPRLLGLPDDVPDRGGLGHWPSGFLLGCMESYIC